MKRLFATSILASLILISISVQGQENSSLDAKLALVTDLKVPAGAISLRLQRKSETKQTQGGLLGKRWRQNWESRLSRAPGRVQLEEWAGVTSFRQVGHTQEYESNSRERIVFSSDGRAVRSKLDGGTETFDTAGRLIERTYRRGNKVLLFYTAHGSLSRVEGPGGSFLSFTTDSAGRAIRVQSSTGATVNYAYDKDNLIEVAVNGGPALRYGYDAKGSPVRIEDPQTGALDIAYDSKERVASYRWVDGSEQRFEYDDAINSKRVIAPNGAATVTQEDPQKRRTEITGPLGHRSVIQFDEAGRPVNLIGPTGASARMSYDSLGRIAAAEDALGRTTRYQYAGESSTVNAIILADGTRQEFEYDSENNLTGIKTGGKIVSALTYNPEGSIASAKEPGAKERKFTYHPNGLVKSEANAVGETKQFEYDISGNLVRETNPLGGVTVRSYDPQNRIVSLTDPAGATTRYEYDVRGRLIRETDPAGSVTAFEYDARGRLSGETNPAGQATRYEYTPLDKIAKVIKPGNQTESYSYDLAGNLTARTDHLGRTTKFEHDPAGRVTREQWPTGLEVRYRYDAAGNLLAVEDSTGSRSEYQTDAFGRTTSRIDPDGGKVQYRYDALGNLLTETDPLGRLKQFTYTADGDLTQVAESSRDEARYEYDAAGRIVAIRRPSGGVNRFTYDPMGNLLTATDPLGNIKRYSYNSAGQLLSSTDATNKVTRYVYDKAGRRVQKQLTDGKRVTYKYDALGRMTEADDGAFPVRVSYDEAGNLKQVEYTAIKKAIAYEYDVHGLRTRMTAPDGREIRYEYDALKRLSALVMPDGSRVALSYDTKNRIQSVLYPNGITGQWSYNAYGQTAKISYQDKSGKAVAGSSYRYDQVGNAVERQDAQGHASRFVYDAADQLIEETNPTYSTKYRYAAGGNRAAVEEGARVSQYKHDAADRLVEAGDERLSYDLNGNLVGRKGPGGSTLYEYDAENRLIKVVTADGATTAFGYAPTGERVWRRDKNGITYFIYDGLNLIAELGEDLRTKATFVHGFGVDRPFATLQDTQSFYFLTDRLGSVTHLADPAGKVAASFAYDAFGKIKTKQGTITSPFAFTGRQLDPTGLYYYRARYYDPSLGRFLSTDLISARLDEPLEQNAYLYVRNNPVGFVDPLGLDSFAPEYLAGQSDESLIELFQGARGDFNSQQQVYRAMRSRGMGTPKGDQMFFARPVPVPRNFEGPRPLEWEPGSPPALEKAPLPGAQKVVGKPGQAATNLNPGETGAAIPKPGPAGSNTQQVGDALNKGNTLRGPAADAVGAGPWKGLLGVNPKGWQIGPGISRAGLAAGLASAAADCWHSGLSECGPRIVGGVVVGGGIYGGIALAAGTAVAGPVTAILGGALAWKEVGTELSQGRADEKQRLEQEQARKAQEEVNLKNRDQFYTRIEQLRGKINALKKHQNAITQNLPLAQQQAAVADAAAGGAASSLDGLRTTKTRKAEISESVCATINTYKPATIQSEIVALAAQAEQLQRDSDRLFNEGKQLADNCASLAAAQSARDKYNSIKTLLGQVVVLKRQADQKQILLGQIRTTLETLKGQSPASVTTDVADKALEADTAAKEASRLMTHVVDAIPVLKAGEAELRREINALHSAVPQALLGDIQDRFNELHGLLSSVTTYALVRYDIQAQDHAKRAALHREEALRLLQAINLTFPCQTEIPSADAAIQRIDKAVTMMGLTDPAVLLQQAQVCEASAKCIPVINQARQQLEQLQIEEGQAAITQARQQGCNVSGLESALDYYRTIRDAAALLFNAKGQCKFQEGVSFAEKMPASMQNNPWLANGIAEVRAGLAAQQSIEQLISKARTAADAGSGLSARNSHEESRRQFAQADGYVAQADSIAAPYSCLAERVSRYKGEYNALKENVNKRSGGQVATTDGSEKAGDKLVVEEIPDETITTNPSEPRKTEQGGFWDNVKEKDAKEKERIANTTKGTQPRLTVEEIPEDSGEPTNAANRPTRKSNKPLTVEEIPEDDTGRDVAANRPSGRGTKPLSVEEIPEDDSAGGSSTGNNPRTSTNTGGSSSETAGNRSSDKPKKEKKPRDPNKPDFWTRLGGAVRQGVTGQPPVVTNNPSGNTNPGGSGGGAGGDQGMDLSGRWIGTNRIYMDGEVWEEVTWRVDLQKTGTAEWSGTPVLVSAKAPQNWKDIGRTPVTIQHLGGGRIRAWMGGHQMDGTSDGSRFSLQNGEYIGVRQ